MIGFTFLQDFSSCHWEIIFIVIHYQLFHGSHLTSLYLSEAGRSILAYFHKLYRALFHVHLGHASITAIILPHYSHQFSHLHPYLFFSPWTLGNTSFYFCTLHLIQCLFQYTGGTQQRLLNIKYCKHKNHKAIKQNSKSEFQSW